jgi:hypothetical protein
MEHINEFHEVAAVKYRLPSPSRAKMPLLNIKYSTNKCTLIIIIFLDIIYYNPCKPAQHVSIPSWDHHQGHLHTFH